MHLVSFVNIFYSFALSRQRCSGHYHEKFGSAFLLPKNFMTTCVFLVRRKGGYHICVYSTYRRQGTEISYLLAATMCSGYAVSNGETHISFNTMPGTRAFDPTFQCLHLAAFPLPFPHN
jgi:hypothetical protein